MQEYNKRDNPMNPFKSTLNKWALDENWLIETLRQAQTKELVTIDIFDTALTRDVDTPIDIFAKVEGKLRKFYSDKAEGFATARENAEKHARFLAQLDFNYEDVTFEEIYKEVFRFIDLTTEQIKQAQELELQTEKESLYAVPDILELTKRLNAAKIPYAFVSDMYLPAEFLSACLQEQGFEGWQHLYVSGYLRKTKHHGSIWSLSGLCDKNILHIGDNPSSDIKQTRKQGLCAILYTRAASDIRTGVELSPSLLPFSQQHRYLTLLMRADPDYEKDPDFDKKLMDVLGRSLGVLSLGSFTLWLRERAQKNGITDLYFIARDGYLLQKGWQLFNRLQQKVEIKDHYIYLSRKVLHMYVACLKNSPSHLRSDFFEEAGNLYGRPGLEPTLKSLGILDNPILAKKAKKAFGRLKGKVVGQRGRKKLHKFLNENSSEFYKILEGHYRNLLGYIKQEGILEVGKIGFVDMGWNGSLTTRLLELVKDLKPQASYTNFFYGVLYTIINKLPQLGHIEAAFFSPFSPSWHIHKQAEVIDIIEELHSMRAGTTAGFEKKNGKYTAICPATPQEEEQYDTFIKPFQTGTLETLQELLETGRSGTLTLKDLTLENAKTACYQVFLAPTDQEVLTLAKIKHGANFVHDLKGITDLSKPRTVRGFSKSVGLSGWKIGIVRYWQLKLHPKKSRVLRRFIKKTVPLQILGPRILQIFERS